jgi:hypothetical protein
MHDESVVDYVDKQKLFESRFHIDRSNKLLIDQ